LRENGARVAPLSTLSWEVRGNGDKPLLHLWSENHNLTRRVLAITDHSEQRLALAVECFGRSKPDRNFAATFANRAGYNFHAFREVVPREFFGQNPPARPSGAGRSFRASDFF
jgi:hypothetical protein